MKKRLTKGSDRFIFGVCSGIAEYFDIDVTLVRLATILLICYAGIGIIPYLVMGICMPSKK